MSQVGCERPAKKRRFFVEAPEDSPPAPPASNAAEPQADVVERSVDNGEPGVQFDSQMLQNFVGEELEPSIIDRLRSMSDGNIERGISRKYYAAIIDGD